MLENNISYIWYLQKCKNENLKLDDFHPYLELYIDKDIININNTIARKFKNEHIMLKYINLISKINYELNSNRLNIISKNEDYIIEKYKLKLSINKDYITILKKILNEVFPDNIIYYLKKENVILIYLDYIENSQNTKLIEKIIYIFVPISYLVKYTFYHIYKLDIKEISKFERWYLL